jgi:hypothetical protein
MRPIFDIDEIPRLETCGSCGYVSEYGSFGPEAVDYGLELVTLALDENRPTEYLDTYVKQLRWCVLGVDADDEERRTNLLDRYEAMRASTNPTT